MSKQLNHKKLAYSVLASAAIVGSLSLTAMLTTSSTAKSANSEVIKTASSVSADTLVDETIYVFTTADGTKKNTISSDWTRNSLGTDLYTKTQEEKFVPLNLEISYTLDGEQISAENLAGKSGKVSVKIKYTNNQKTGDYYTPYAVISGIILDNATFKNVEVKNAKTINDGSRTIVAGLALPGLKENLALSSADIPDSFEFTADATSFKLGNIFSLATTEVFADIDTSSLNTIDDLESSLNALTSAMQQLIDGSSSLKGGLEELYGKVASLPESTQQLADGGAALKTGLETLDTVYTPQLLGGADQLVNTLAQLSLVDPTNVFYPQIKAALEELQTGLIGYTDGVNSAAVGAANLSEGLDKLNANTPALVDGIKQLKDGSAQLQTGLNSFNEQGIKKLVNIYNGDIKSLKYRLDNTINLAKNSNTKVKYIYRTDEIK